MRNYVTTADVERSVGFRSEINAILLHGVCAPFILGTDFDIHAVSWHDVHLATQTFTKTTRWQHCMVAKKCLDAAFAGRSTLADHWGYSSFGTMLQVRLDGKRDVSFKREMMPKDRGLADAKRAFERVVHVVSVMVLYDLSYPAHSKPISGKKSLHVINFARVKQSRHQRSLIMLIRTRLKVGTGTGLCNAEMTRRACGMRHTDLQQI